MRSTAARRCGLIGAAALACLATAGHGDVALEWRDVAADEPIDHAVMIRGPFDEAHRQVRLRGPVALVAAGDEAACFTAYAAAAGDDEPERAIEVGAGDALRLGPPAFLLVPATRLGDGTPADAARAVYEARPILDPPATIAGAPVAAGRPAYLCVPVDYRHHFDHLPVEDAGRGVMIFAARPVEPAAAAAKVVDDFGLNRVVPDGGSRAAAWITVRPVAGH